MTTIVPVKHEFELSRLEYKGKSYYVKGEAIGYYDAERAKVTDMTVSVSTCMEMPVCEVPEGIDCVVAECLERESIEWERA